MISLRRRALEEIHIHSWPKNSENHIPASCEPQCEPPIRSLQEAGFTLWQC
jgi:hypothetical protein